VDYDEINNIKDLTNEQIENIKKHDSPNQYIDFLKKNNFNLTEENKIIDKHVLNEETRKIIKDIFENLIIKIYR
jgi:hypothetical protein